MDTFGLVTLEERRKKRCLDFSLKCLKNPRTARLFPMNPNQNNHLVRSHELFKVNFAKTSTYKKSAIPFCQRLLNEHFAVKKKKWNKTGCINLNYHSIVNDSLMMMFYYDKMYHNIFLTIKPTIIIIMGNLGILHGQLLIVL